MQNVPKTCYYELNGVLWKQTGTCEHCPYLEMEYVFEDVFKLTWGPSGGSSADETGVSLKRKSG